MMANLGKGGGQLLKKNRYHIPLGLLVWVGIVWAFPPPPSGYYGYITIDDQNVPPSGIVSAMIDGNYVASHFVITVPGQYGIMSVNGDDPATPDTAEGGVEGDTVYFELTLHGQEYRLHPIGIWLEGSLNWLNLVQHSPTILSLPDTLVYEDLPYEYVLVVEDEDGDHLTYQYSIGPHWLYWNSISQSLTGIPTSSDLGDTMVVVDIFDGCGGSAQQAFPLHILNTNDVPVIDFIPPQHVLQDQHFIFQVTASDEDLGDRLTFSDNTPLFDIDPDSGRIDFIPGNDNIGDHRITITVTDLSGASDSARFLLTVINVYDSVKVNLITPPPEGVTVNAFYTFKWESLVDFRKYAFFNLFLDTDTSYSNPGDFLYWCYQYHFTHMDSVTIDLSGVPEGIYYPLAYIYDTVDNWDLDYGGPLIIDHIALSHPKVVIRMRNGYPVLSWESIPGAVGYKVYRSSQPCFLPNSGLLIATLGLVNSWTDSTISAEHEKFYRVTSVTGSP